MSFYPMSNDEQRMHGCERMREAAKTCLMCGSRGSCSFEVLNDKVPRFISGREFLHAGRPIGISQSMSDLAESQDDCPACQNTPHPCATV